MNQELKEILTGITLFVIVVSIAMFYSGTKNDRPSDRAIKNGYEYFE